MGSPERKPTPLPERSSAVAKLAMGRSPPLGSFASILLEARNEKVRQTGRVLICAVLTALGGGPLGNATSSDSASPSARPNSTGSLLQILQ